MARSRGSSPSSGRSTSRAAPSRPAAAPAPAASTSTLARPPAPIAGPPAVSSGGGGGMMSGIGSTIVQGMAFGTGSAIAHRAVGAIAESFSGPKESAPAPVAAPPTSFAPPVACSSEIAAFNKCLTEFGGDLASCQWHFDTLKSCQTERL